MTATTPHQHLVRALVRWPSFGVEHTFLARLNSGILDAAALAEFAPEDFYLACAALKGVPAAIAQVETLLAQQFAALGHFRLSSATLEDIRVTMLSNLVVESPDSPARLERYSGTGPLAGWLRVAATREVLTWMRRNQRPATPDDESLLGNLETPSEAPELAHLKDKYRGQFAAAFRQAIGQLEVRQRNLLRQHYLDELSLEELADMYKVHRATAARWLAAARATLLEKTRDEISRSLGLPRLEVDSLMRVVQSRLDLSAGIFLSEGRK
jgi:RNA polymerase sigma-70 factor (ECF subfamily)